MIKDSKISQHFHQVLKHLYISPLEQCNLNCKICYTAKTKAALSNEEILAFIHRYQAVQNLETVTFCGGEVFLPQDFCQLVNQLTAANIFVQIITNGTIDHLAKLERANMINLIVSLDGLANYHEQNRGAGTFTKSINFLRKAQKLGFNFEIFSIVTQENLSLIPQFEQTLKATFKQTVPVTYHPRKPISYLQKHPSSNRLGQVAGFSFLRQQTLKKLMQTKNTFPPQGLGCYQISLMANKQIYACCEGIKTVGDINTPIEILIRNLEQRLITWEQTYAKHKCLGCVEADFICGLPETTLVCA